jgi:proline iminopeptidase
MKYYISIITLFLAIILFNGCSKSKEQENEKDKMTDKTSGVVSVKGAKLRYVIEGDGIPCIVIGSSIYYPRTFSPLLREHLKLIFVDTRHYVPSDTTFSVEEVDLDTYLDDIEQVRKELNLNKIVVMGHSVHSLLAYEYAQKYPQNTSHVIMIGSFPVGGEKRSNASDEFWETDASDRRKTIQKENMEKLSEYLQNDISEGEEFKLDYIYSAPKYWSDPTYDCSWIWEGINLNVDVMYQLFGAIFNDYEITNDSNVVTTPVFLALGRFDYIAPYYLWDDVKNNISNLSYNLFEKSGHTPQLEEHALFDKKLLEWINSN